MAPFSAPEAPDPGPHKPVIPPIPPASSDLQFTLNGKPILIQNPNPRQTLADYIRREAGLTGTKISCNQGGCGACTVMLSAPPQKQKSSWRKPVNSCLQLLCSVGGLEVTTVEGVAGEGKKLHPVQRAIVEHDGTQCGFCTSGMVMSFHSLLEENPEPTSAAIEGRLDGNLCRCTGFRSILNAGQSLACAKPCAKPCAVDIEDLKSPPPPFVAPTAPSCVDGKPQVWSLNDHTWITATSLPQLYAILRAHIVDRPIHVPGLSNGPQSSDSQRTLPPGDISPGPFRCGPGARMVAGNTSTGVYAPSEAGLLIDISRVPELLVVHVEKEGVRFGGGVTIADAIRVLDANRTLSSTYGPLHRHMERVAHHQVRSTGSLAGNLMMAHAHESFASDLATNFTAAGAIITCGSALTPGKTPVRVSITEFFELGFKGLVIEEVFLPAFGEGVKLVTHKVALRRQNAHALVNMALRAAVTAKGVFERAPVIVFGGVAGRAKRASKTEAFLEGKAWGDDKVLEDALNILGGELLADPYTPRREYRQSLVTTLFYKAYLALVDPTRLPERLRSAAAPYERPVSSGSVTFDVDPSEFPVSKPIHKLSAEIQTTGEAHYLDDLPLRSNELHAAYAMSTQANATIDVIDASAALSMRGVKGFISAESMVKDGYCNMVGRYERLLASHKVDYYGQAVGIVVADSHAHATAAAEMVSVTYKDVSKPILNIQDAIKAKSFFEESYRTLDSGEVTKGFADADVTLEGEVSLGHAYHFHMETQRAAATPAEEGAIEIVSSTQNISQVQAVAANVLNIPQHKVTVSVKRVGGAFGGKINRATPIAAATALAAATFKRPVRTVLDLSTNMQMVGARTPYYVKYKVAATSAGKLTAVQLKIYMDQGMSHDMDLTDMGAIFLAFDNVYSCPNWRFEGWAVRTNFPIHTYMRAPSTLEGVYVIENVIEHVAHVLGLSGDDVRERNFYKKNDVTPFGQILTYCNARLLYDMVKESSGYDKRRAAIQDFNAANRWVKRGISLVPVRFCVGWAAAPFSALVNIYPDGSIRLDTSGVEMGQGLNAKIAQVASYALGTYAKGGVPMSLIRTGATTTLVANNSGGTESSIGSELSSKAVDKACAKIGESLLIARRACLAESEEPTWQQLIGKAVDLGLDLQAAARVDEDPPTRGPFQYMSYGACVTEAEADVLTGEWRSLRTDILLDCGKSLNPAVDVGQIQGGYVMGLGNFLCEEMLYDDRGKNLSDSSWEYKIPSSQDIPVEFHVSLLQKSGNPSGFLRSKCSGEPPSAMACSANLAIRSAISSARAERNETTWFCLNSPGTVEKIALASKTPTELLTLKAT